MGVAVQTARWAPREGTGPRTARTGRTWLATEDVPLEEAYPLLQAASRHYDRLKTALDVAVGALALLLTLPLMALAALAVRLSSRGPVIFRQQRAGRNGRVFTMYKFRTMCQGAHEQRPALQGLNEAKGPVFKIRHDPRITPVGAFLRRSSLDELPQLFNVLAGHMSLVGPRPLWVEEAKGATGLAQLRAAVKPGLTCLWQISGRSELSYRQWVDLDLFYILNRSTSLDLMILVQTLPAVLSARGAY